MTYTGNGAYIYLPVELDKDFVNKYNIDTSNLHITIYYENTSKYASYIQKHVDNKSGKLIPEKITTWVGHDEKLYLVLLFNEKERYLSERFKFWKNHGLTSKHKNYKPHCTIAIGDEKIEDMIMKGIMQEDVKNIIVSYYPEKIEDVINISNKMNYK